MNTNLSLSLQPALSGPVEVWVPGTRSRTLAFTIVELLTIIAVLGCLALAVVPAMTATKPENKAIRCQNNLRQLTAAWSLYASDHGERVANNFGVTEVITTIVNGRFENWANNVMSWSASGGVGDRSTTNIMWATNGLLGLYLGGAWAVYKCPSDTYLSRQQQAAGWIARLRTYSMNSVFGRFSTGRDPTADGLNWGLQEYVQYLKQTQVPKPGKTWLFIEEQADSINDGYFINNPQVMNWQDLPASYHNGSCSFAFADGHTELKKWQSRTSVYPVRYSYGSTKSFDPPGRADYGWYLSHTGFKRASTGQLMYGY